MFRVVVLLSTHAGFISTYHESKEEAIAFIASWVNRQLERIKKNDFSVETTLYHSSEYAIMGQFIIGMYLVASDPDEEWRS